MGLANIFQGEMLDLFKRFAAPHNGIDHFERSAPCGKSGRLSHRRSP